MPRSLAPRIAACCAAPMLLLLPASHARAQAPGAARPLIARALRVEDFYSIRTPGAPTLSPDGRWVAFTVTSRVEATNAEPSEVWLVPSDASRPAERVSPEGERATSPRWTDEGRLRFTGERKAWQLHPDSRVLEQEAARAATRGANGEVTLPAHNGNALLDGAVDYEQVIAGTEPDLADVQPSPDDLYIVYTGGTTGMPKGVLWRQNDIFMGACGGRNVYTGEAVTTLAEIAERAGEKII